MKNLKAKLVVGTILLTAGAAQAGAGPAHHSHYPGCGHTYGRSGCLVDDKILLGTELEESQACELGKKLELKEGWFNFSLLKDSPYLVKYWDGSYLKPQIYKKNYMRYITNVCTQEVVYEGKFSETHTKYLSFSAKNPNISPKIDKTYLLVPMTRDEAKAEMARALRECEQ